MGLKEIKALSGPLGLKVYKALRALRAPRVSKDFSGTRGFPEPLLKAPRAHREIKGLKVFRDFLDSSALKEIKVRKARRVFKGRKVLGESKEIKEIRGTSEIP